MSSQLKPRRKTKKRTLAVLSDDEIEQFEGTSILELTATLPVEDSDEAYRAPQGSERDYRKNIIFARKARRRFSDTAQKCGASGETNVGSGNQAELHAKPKFSRQRSVKKAKGKQTQPQQQPLTELTAVCHCFSDEVQKYIHPLRNADDDGSALDSSRFLSYGEKLLLRQLTKSVSQQVTDINPLVIENRNLVTEGKYWESQVKHFRDHALVVKMQIRNILDDGNGNGEIGVLQEELEQRREQWALAERASKFLGSLEKLVASCRRHQNLVDGNVK